MYPHEHIACLNTLWLPFGIPVTMLMHYLHFEVFLCIFYFCVIYKNSSFALELVIYLIVINFLRQ